MRCLLDKNLDQTVKDARLYKFVIDFIEHDADFFKLVVCQDREILEKYIKPYDLMAFRSFGANALKDVYKK